MPVPNDFRLSGALGGLVASQEYQAEQEKQNLANLLTQAQTAQQTQQTQQAQQLLPFLLQQREQENQIRAKEALSAQMGMRNVPQEVANRGQELTLAGMTNQANLENFDENQKIAGKERQGKGMALDQANQLSALRKVHYIMQTQGPLAASSVAGELGMNPKVLMENPEMIPRAISMIENQMMRTPQHLSTMAGKELDAVKAAEVANIQAGPQYARIAAEKEWRKEDRDAKTAAKTGVKKLEELATQDLIAARQAANDLNVPVEERERLVAQAQQSYLAYTQARAAAQQQGVILDPDTMTLQPTRPGGAAPQLPAMPSAPTGSGGNNQSKGSATGQTKSGNSYRIEKQ